MSKYHLLLALQTPDQESRGGFVYLANCNWCNCSWTELFHLCLRHLLSMSDGHPISFSNVVFGNLLLYPLPLLYPQWWSNHLSSIPHWILPNEVGDLTNRPLGNKTPIVQLQSEVGQSRLTWLNPLAKTWSVSCKTPSIPWRGQSEVKNTIQMSQIMIQKSWLIYLNCKVHKKVSTVLWSYFSNFYVLKNNLINWFEFYIFLTNFKIWSRQIIVKFQNTL